MSFYKSFAEYFDGGLKVHCDRWIVTYYVFIPKKTKESKKDLMARKKSILDKLRSIIEFMYMDVAKSENWNMKIVMLVL